MPRSTSQTHLQSQAQAQIERRMKTLNFIRLHILRHVTPPTYREIDQAVRGETVSSSTAWHDVAWLKRSGALKVTGDGPDDYTLPELWDAVQKLREMS